MRRVLNWLLWGLAGLVLLVLATGLGAYGLLRNTIAPLEGTAELAGLSQDVSVVKSEHAIPHIEAASRADALRALGWVHASERIWQMEVLRMAAQGRMSELFGEKTVATDRFLKTLDIASASKAAINVVRADSRKLLEAYAEGINSWLERETGALEPSLPIEFIILGHNPEPWEPWHSAAILKVMALSLDANMEEEIGRLTLAGKGFNARQIGEVYPAGPRDEPPELPDLRAIYGFDKTGKVSASNRAGINIAEVPLAEAPWTLQLPASNNWAIAPAKTVNGKPLLANDPHLGLTAPSTFYLAHLRWLEEGKTVNQVGGTLPGTPFVLSGRNDRVAWGLTTTNMDSQDLFLEQIIPDNPGYYRTEEGSLPFESEEVTIKVKGGEDVPFTRRKTRNGPVLPDGYKKLKERLPEGHVAALSWTALLKGDTTIDGIFDMGVSGDVAQFIKTTSRMRSPMQSIVIADADGNIALMAPGRVPVRSKFNRIAGRAPVPGWMAKYQWQEFLNHEQLPRILNPVNGAVGSANSNWLPTGYEHHITHDWAEHFRHRRMEQLYHQANRKQSLATMQAGQADTLSLALLEFRDEILIELPQGVRLNETVLSALRDWDGRMDGDRPEPLILVAWHRHLQERLLSDDLGEDFDLVKKGKISRILYLLKEASARNWCNRVETPAVETCGDMLFEAGELALAELSEAHGVDWSKWRWGDANISLHEHRPFTRVNALSGLFTIRQRINGGKYTLLRNSNDFRKDEPYAGVHGSALRTAYDFADLEQSLFMVSNGQSGNVMSPHYSDLAEKWGAVEYITIPTDPKTYREGAKVFTLEVGG